MAAEIFQIQQDVFDHLPRLHKVAARMMVERGELEILNEEESDDRTE
ncbi:hypothetical protein [Methanocalculus natronophilus]